MFQVQSRGVIYNHNNKNRKKTAITCPLPVLNKELRVPTYCYHDLETRVNMSHVISLTLAEPSFITLSFWSGNSINYCTEISALPLIDCSNLLTVCLNPNSAQISGSSLNRPKSLPVWVFEWLWNLSISSILMSEHVRAQSFRDGNWCGVNPLAKMVYIVTWRR